MHLLALNNLPIPAHTLQSSLSQLHLSSSPSAPRRSTIFPTSTPGIWARVTPFWTSWPIRVSQDDAEEMGLDLETGFDVDDVLQNWEATEVIENAMNGLSVKASKRRQKINPILLSVSESALKETLSNLDVGDALDICQSGSKPIGSNSARESFLSTLSGRQILSSDSYGPWSTRYCGHQFGQWAGQLGDGRAVSIMETENDDTGRWEVQLKGSGRTPFSRGDDGLATLRGGVREFLGCEAVAALGIPTTRSLALLTTPLSTLPVFRDDNLHVSSLLVRLAPSFIRVGHFEALNPPESAGKGSKTFILGGGEWVHDRTDENVNETEDDDGRSLEGLRDLGVWMKDHIMSMPDATWKEWAEDVIKRNAEMVALWQVYGYMNGVINTDNVTVLGLTIDYGPYAFMDVYDDRHICNSSDTSGMYAYKNQPSRIAFALSKFISSISPLIGYSSTHDEKNIPKGYSQDKSREELETWSQRGKEVMQEWQAKFTQWEESAEMEGWYRRFGLKTEQEDDPRVIKYDYLLLLRTHHLDFHSSFRLLSEFSLTSAIESQQEGRKYMEKFVKKFGKATNPEMAEHEQILLESELIKWLNVYAKRASLSTEQEAWSDTNSTPSTSLSNWETVRKTSMLSHNPSFVLRPWILEEVCANMEDALTKAYKSASSKDDLDQGKVEEGWKEARKELEKILRMAISPFKDLDEQDFEGRRLCGLGTKDDVGMQCSCSNT